MMPLFTTSNCRFSEKCFPKKKKKSLFSLYLYQVRLRPRLRRLQKRLPAETLVRSHVHATGQVFGPVSVGVEGQPEAVQHGPGVHHVRRRDDDRRRGIVDPMPLGGVRSAGRKGHRRVPRMDRGPGQWPTERVRLRVRRHIRSGNAARLSGQASGRAPATVADDTCFQGTEPVWSWKPVVYMGGGSSDTEQLFSPWMIV